MKRRDFLGMAGWAATFAALGGGRPAGAVAGGARAVPVIDGAGGTGLFWLEDGDPRIAEELTHLRASGLNGLVMTVAPSGRFWLDDEAYRRALESVARCTALADRFPDAISVVRDAADLDRVHRESKTGLILTFQGTEPLGEDVERIPLFRARGVRVIQLTHNRRNLVGDGCMEPGNAGLSNFGLEVVERLNAERMVVDLAHGAPRTIADGIRASAAPVLISHTGCRALADVPRNVADAELRAMAERGGVAGIIFWPYLRTDTQPTAEDVVRHLEHAIRVCGEDHVGIGTDGPVAPVERTPEFEKQNREYIAGMIADGIFEQGRPLELYTFIPELNVADRFGVLGEMLAARGHPEARIDKILGGNFARVMREVWG